MSIGTSAAQTMTQAESLLKSLKGVQDARVHVNADGKIARICVVCPGVDERSATRNVQSALFAVLGVSLDPGMLQFSATLDAPKPEIKKTEPIVAFQQMAMPSPVQLPAVNADEVPVLEITGAARRADLNVAARVAFDTLRAAQSSFHGFLFDGAELVKISGSQYVVVAVRRSTTEARYCGAAPVIDSVSTASARALMNAVGIAAMGTPAGEFAVGENHLESLEA